MRPDYLTVIGIRRLWYWPSCCLHLEIFLVLRECLVEISIKIMVVVFRNHIYSIFITVCQSSSELRNVNKSDIVGKKHNVLVSRFLQRCQWGFRCSRLWGLVAGKVVRDVSMESFAFFLNGLIGFKCFKRCRQEKGAYMDPKWRIIENKKTFWLAKRLPSSQEGICYMATIGSHFVYLCGRDTAKDYTDLYTSCMSQKLMIELIEDEQL